MAHLRSPGKGANKTRRIASLLTSPRSDETGPSAAARTFRGRFAARMELPARRKRVTRVTTISAAEPSRRDFLYIATAAVGAVGAAATLAPLIGQMSPDASTIAAGAPVEVDLSPLAEGQIVQAFWRSKPIFIFFTAPSRTLRAPKWWIGRRCAIRSPIRRASRLATSNGSSSSASVRISAAFRCRIKVTLTAGSDHATARNTILRAVSGKDRRRSICRCRLISLYPIPRSGSAKPRPLTHKVRP